MDAKEYLSQAKFLDTRINSKIKQVDSLRAMATSATSALTGMPHSPNKATSKMADIVDKIVDMQEEINQEIDALVDLKKSIANLINALENPDQQTLLEKRYLCLQSWEQIAVDMGFSLHYLYKVHNVAIEKCDEILKRIPKDIE